MLKKKYENHPSEEVLVDKTFRNECCKSIFRN